MDKIYEQIEALPLDSQTKAKIKAKARKLFG